MERKAVLCKGVTCPPELPCASQLFIHFLTKHGKPFTKEIKSWLHKKGHPFSMVHCRVTLLAGLAFLCIKHYGSPSWVNSGKVRQSEHVQRCWFRQMGQPFCQVNTRLSWLNWREVRVGEGGAFSLDKYPSYKQGLLERNIIYCLFQLF